MVVVVMVVVEVVVVANKIIPSSETECFFLLSVVVKQIPTFGETNIHPGNLTAKAPENRPKLPKGKDRLPWPSFFRVELLNFGGVGWELLQTP